MCRKYWLTACSSLPRKKFGLVKDHPAMTIAVDLGCKATKQTNQTKLGTKTKKSRNLGTQFLWTSIYLQTLDKSRVHN